MKGRRLPVLPQVPAGLRPTPNEEAIVLLGHGSRDREGSAEFISFTERLSEHLERPVHGAFLELASPPVLTVLERLAAGGARNILAMPWLLVGAGHAKNDLPAAIQLFRSRHPEVTVRYGTPLSIQPEVLEILGDRLAAVDPNGGHGSSDTAVLLVQRGSTDPDANSDVYRAARLLWEGRKFAAVEVAFSGVTRPSVAEGLDRCLTLGVRRVLVLPYYLCTGILVKRIAETLESIATAHPECDFVLAPHLGLDVRLLSLAERKLEEVRSGTAAMTCDHCQYRTPLRGREDRVGSPPVTDHFHGLREGHRGLDDLLPPRYRNDASVCMLPMEGAALQFDAEGRVAWDRIWTDFCDLALAGGPPHRGTLLEPADREEVAADPDAYERVAEEIERGLRLVTGLNTFRGRPGWVGIACGDEEMATWLLRAIVVENVSVRREGSNLLLPAGPTFRLEEEIKNVITVGAKTHHYWSEHAQAAGVRPDSV